jgi:hypothetical protein
VSELDYPLAALRLLAVGVGRNGSRLGIDRGSRTSWSCFGDNLYGSQRPQDFKTSWLETELKRPVPSSTFFEDFR